MLNHDDVYEVERIARNILDPHLDEERDWRRESDDALHIRVDSLTDRVVALEQKLTDLAMGVAATAAEAEPPALPRALDFDAPVAAMFVYYAQALLRARLVEPGSVHAAAAVIQFEHQEMLED